MTPPASLQVCLHGHLSFYEAGHRSRLEYALAQPAPLREVLATLGVPAAEVWLAAINGEHATLDAIVAPGDHVDLYPPMGGG